MRALQALWSGVARAGRGLAFVLAGLAGAAAADVEYRGMDTAFEAGGSDVCLLFSHRIALPPGRWLADYVSLTPAADADIMERDGAVCIAGLDRGVDYTVAVRAGLPAANGDRLARTRQIAVSVPDAPPQMRFGGNGFVLPTGAGGVVPLTVVNRDRVALDVIRVTDRNIITQLHRLGTSQDAWDIGMLRDVYGETVWSGSLETAAPANQPRKIGIPLDEVLDTAEPGVHLLVAMPAAAADEVEALDRYDAAITQWVTVSGMGLTGFGGRQGLTVLVNDLATGQAMPDVSLTLLARNNRRLAEARSDAGGVARFDAGLLRGGGGNTAVAVLAYGPDNDFTVLRLADAAFDLSDRGVAGRHRPAGLDGFVWADRDIVRPGETIHLAALLRHAGRAAPAVPATLVLERPDGKTFRTLTLQPAAGGAYTVAVALPPDAPVGRWRADFRVGGASLQRFGFAVEDFVPERLDLTLAATGNTIRPGESVPVTVRSRFLFGAPAADLILRSGVILEADPDPFPAWTDYAFGLVDDDPPPRRVAWPDSRTDQAGAAVLSATLPDLPDNSRELQARVWATVLEPGGRGVTRSVALGVRSRPFSIGIRRDFGDRPAGPEAGFSVIALAPDGTARPGRALRWALLRERQRGYWTRNREDGGWEYVMDHTLSRPLHSGRTTSRDRPVTLTVPVARRGDYRLEVYDPETGVASSVRFSSHGAGSRDAGPDRLPVSVEQRFFRPGETVRLLIDAPFAGSAIVSVLGTEVIARRRVPVTAGRHEVRLRATEAWDESGVYLAVHLLRGAPSPAARVPGDPPLSRRALGIVWLPRDIAGRRLDVAMAKPDVVRPRQPATVAVSVQGLAPGEPAWLTLAAVDQGILALTGYQTPDPLQHFLGQYRLPVDIYDLYGQLIDSRHDRVGLVRAGGDAMPAGSGPGPDSHRSVALFSGLVTVRPDGTARIPLDIPDFAGELRLMAVAFSAEKYGIGRSTLTVRDPVVAELSRPRFLAPGDHADLSLELHNTDGPAGLYRVRVQATGPVAVTRSRRTLLLPQGGKFSGTVGIHATGTGVATVSLDLTGPDGLRIRRDFSLPLRPAHRRRETVRTIRLEPGQSLRLDSAPPAGLLPETVETAINVGALPAFNLPGLAASLAYYPYGCLEQTVSAAMPLLHALNASPGKSGPGESGSGDRAGVGDRAPGRPGLQAAVWRVVDMQRPDGAFGLWHGGDDADFWLTGYALDFLSRAAAAGLVVPGSVLLSGHAWLAEAVNDRFAGEDGFAAARAYGVYVLARAGDGAAAGAARYMADHERAQLDAGALAQLASALVLLGETDRAARVMATTPAAGGAWRPDSYGSPLRDAAMRLALLAESPAATAASLGMAARRVARLYERQPRPNTQEQAWLVRAAHALDDLRLPVAVTVDGTVRDAVGSLTLRPEASTHRHIFNRGDRPLHVGISTIGLPDHDPPARQNRMRLRRRHMHLDGTPMTVDEPFIQGRRYIVLLEGRSRALPDHGLQQVMLDDRLPAGLEIENTRLDNRGGLDDFSWLPELDTPRHVEMRDDRFLAAFDLDEWNQSFRIAYIVRAVTAGHYTRPAAHVEDMYRPSFLARGAVDRIAVLPAGG